VLVHGYCIMNNHVHWLVTPKRANRHFSHRD
jgi:REP element-mobilizing transposase RayT